MTGAMGLSQKTMRQRKHPLGTTELNDDQSVQGLGAVLGTVAPPPGAINRGASEFVVCSDGRERLSLCLLNRVLASLTAWLVALSTMAILERELLKASSHYL
uniref:Uncharacterized protein n=1 Tax=Ascaris lumbricoides TaxID=6252 RepID=A0A0M3HSF7_ASCLU